MNKKLISELKNSYILKKKRIRERLMEFEAMGKKNDKKIFSEMAFCICTPQSNARKCYETVNDLENMGILYNGKPIEMEKYMRGVRFYKNKSRYIVSARNFFGGNNLVIKKRLKSFKDNKEMREFLVKNVKGLGYKEASHFLRNIGKGDNLVILDRHILRKMVHLEIIDEIPKSISRKIYLDIENKFIRFSNSIGIPIDELDLLLWSEETGEIFK